VRFECRVIPCAEKWGRSIPWSGVTVKKDVLARKVPFELARPHGGKRQSALRFIRFLDLLLRYQNKMMGPSTTHFRLRALLENLNFP
jgi:hypothetical protein